MSISPKTIDKHFDAVAFWEDGSLILGASSLCGRYWSGSLWCFKNCDDAPEKEKCITGVETDSGVCDIVPVGPDQIFLGLDSGGVEILHLDGEPRTLNSIFYACEHDDLVISVDATCQGKKAISGSFDMGIKIWDLETLVSVATMRPAHGSPVYRVAFSPDDPDVFLSCGQDGRVLLWDQRTGPRATALVPSCGWSQPSCVAWQAGNLVAVGDSLGHVTLLDIKASSEPICQFKLHNTSVFRMVYHPSRPGLLASCSNDVDVVVSQWEGSQATVRYRSCDHEDCVRGLSWNPASKHTLVSCSWDNNIRSHNIPIS